MKILYYDNCWFTNVGESFVDIGAIEMIKKIFPGAQIANISNMSCYYVPPIKSKMSLVKKRKSIDNQYELLDTLRFLEFDVLVLAGMFMSEGHLQGKVSEFVRRTARAGKKIIFLGLGEESGINDNSINLYKEYLEYVCPVLVATRDKKTYEHLRGGNYPLIQGLDAAFWVRDGYDPRGFSKEKYDIVSYCRTDEPAIFSKQWKYPIIRVWHMQWEAQNHVFANKTFISDIPFDYITLYANAHRVYTDLVHATIISLQFGKKVDYSFFDNRSDAFNDIECIQREGKTIFIDESDLERIKEQEINLIKEFL